MIRRMRRIGGVMAAVSLAALGLALAPRPVGDTLPDRLSDKDFWNLSQQFSEENGYFRSDNLLSNELGFQTVIPELLQRSRQNAVYMGVGPEQNFTYIAALHPKLALITDIRRGNLQEQLMYKALFELSADRAEFLSRLFSKKEPAGLGPKSTADQLVNGYWTVDTSDALYKQNLAAIEDLLTKTHGLPLSQDDLKGIEYVYYEFYWWGPSITYGSSGGGNGGGRGGNAFATYADLMVQNDGAGDNRGFLGSEAAFDTVKDLEARNLIVPVVGDFAGPKALRAEGVYLKAHGATVAAFYLSNVEQYLYQDGKWNAFCGNVATLPLDDSSTFIRSTMGGGFGFRGGGLSSQLGSMLTETRACAGK